MTSDWKEYYSKRAAEAKERQCNECQFRVEPIPEIPGGYIGKGSPVARDFFTDKAYPCEHFEPPMFDYWHEGGLLFARPHGLVASNVYRGKP